MTRFNMTKDQMEQMEWLMGEDRNCEIAVTEDQKELKVNFETQDEHYDSYSFYDDGSVVRVLGTGWCNNKYDVIKVYDD